MKCNVFAKSSSSQLPIFSYEFGNKGPDIFILGGIHGDEVEGIHASYFLLEEFIKEFPYQLKLTLLPVFNPEGFFSLKRMNGNGVDLNRNLPTKNWKKDYKTKRYYPGKEPGSESENKALIQFLKVKDIKLIISLHSWNPLININGDCFPEAEILSKKTNYKITDDIGYPTPGSLGEYCGLERGIPTITYEIQKGSNPHEIRRLHIPAIKEALFASEKRR